MLPFNTDGDSGSPVKGSCRKWRSVARIEDVQRTNVVEIGGNTLSNGVSDDSKRKYEAVRQC